MSERMTSIQREQLACLIHSLRPDWGVPGIAKALLEAADQGDAFNLTVAAVRAAADEGNRTPAIIGLNGAHWLGIVHKTPKIDKADICNICQRPRLKCEEIARRQPDPHEFEPSA